MERNKKRRNTALWISIGAIILILLLLVWLTMTDMWGNTDVAAVVIPAI